MSTALSEPEVLAHAKRRLFPETDNDAGYAVADTQFAQSEWLPGESIAEAVRERLAPFNHVRLGSGYPDLVGVRALEPELLAVERLGEPPLVAVEAKGHTAGGVDVERGIVQAYDRLGEANAAYVAAPADAVAATDRTLARELNVGVLAVGADGGVDPVERPRVVGHRTPPEAAAIRFQAGTQGVADDSFGLNHPKNYLGYPLALYHPEATAAILGEYVVGATAAARQGAAALGLVSEQPGGVRLEPLGREVVRFALDRHGSVKAALETFASWKRSRARFVDSAPSWGQLARRVLWAYPATQLLVGELEDARADGEPDPSLAEFVEWCHYHHPTFAVELFIRGTDGARERVLDGDGEIRRAALTDGEVYHAPTVFQLKAMLYHAGVLAEHGAEPHRLDPTTDSWALRRPLDRR